MTRLTLAIGAVVCAVVLGTALRAQDATKKAYILVQVEVSNPSQYAEYTKLSPGIIAKFGGRFIVRGGRTETFEGAPATGRLVVVEFPSFERAQQFYNSAEYQAAKKVRSGAATAQFILVEGL